MIQNARVSEFINKCRDMHTCRQSFPPMEEVASEVRLALQSSAIEKYENVVYRVRSRDESEKAQLKSLLGHGNGSEHCTVVEIDFVKERPKASRRSRRNRRMFGESPVERFNFREEGPSIEIFNAPILLYGEYVKMSRSMCQSPLRIGGELKTARCVSDFCTEFQKFFGSGPVKFMASGREDADVRCLEGRPFVVEVTYPTRNLNASVVCLHLYEEIGIRNLCFVSGRCKDVVNCGTPTKTYNVLVFSEQRIDFRSSYALEQRTPLRVLHRRANILRKRAVDVLRVEELEDSSGYYYDVDVRSSSGTYIKEWVSGDFGRTVPGLNADVLELDVIRVELEIDPALVLRKAEIAVHAIPGNDV